MVFLKLTACGDLIALGQKKWFSKLNPFFSLAAPCQIQLSNNSSQLECIVGITSVDIYHTNCTHGDLLQPQSWSVKVWVDMWRRSGTRQESR